MKSSSAFTIIELIFVIVVLGILASVALPKFASTGEQAKIAAAKADVMAIRSGILNERQARLLTGSSTYIPNGTGTYTVGGRTYKRMDEGGLFGGVLTYPIAAVTSGDGWKAGGTAGTYTFTVNGSVNNFTYYDSTAAAANRGKFLCTSGNECNALTK